MKNSGKRFVFLSFPEVLIFEMSEFRFDNETILISFFDKSDNLGIDPE